MKFHDVAITGMGVVCSGGDGCEAFSETLIQGVSALSPVTDPRVAHFGTIYAGLVHCDFMEDACVAGEDRFVRLAHRAASQAVMGAQIGFGDMRCRAGVFLGTCSGPMLTIEDQYRRESAGLLPEASALERRQYFHATELLARTFGIRGPQYTVTTACSAFCVALATACDLIRSGLLDAALVTGADAFSLTTLAGFVGLKAVSHSQCAPFSLPVGLNLGEGAAAVVVEGQKSAQRRGARIIASVEGYGLSNDAYHCSAPDPTGRGAACAMNGALDDAGCSPDDISYISAHGTGTEANDKAETKAIRRVFGDSAPIPPVSSAKSVVGHCLGAAGAIETVAALLCAERGVMPQTVNFTGPREGCNLDYIAQSGRSWPSEKRWFKNNFAFGGNNASVIIKNGRPDPARSALCDVTDEAVVITSAGIMSAAGPAAVSPGFSADYFTSEVAGPVERRFDGVHSYRGSWSVRTVPDFNSADIDRRISMRGMDRAGMVATAAAALALRAGRMSERSATRMATGFFMNLAQGSSRAEREHVASLLGNDFHIEQINIFPYIVPNAVTGTVARALSLTGYNSTFCNGPGAGLQGIVAAWSAVKNRHAPALLCGSVDDLSEEWLYDCIAPVVSGETRPVLGEGSVMLLLESASSALSRGVEPLGTMLDCLFSDEESLCDTMETMLGQHDIGDDEVITLCSNNLHHRSLDSFRKSHIRCKDIDCRLVSGWMPAGQELFNLVAALLDGRSGDNSTRNYIFITLFSPRGKATTALISSNIIRKSDATYDGSGTGINREAVCGHKQIQGGAYSQAKSSLRTAGPA